MLSLFGNKGVFKMCLGPTTPSPDPGWDNTCTGEAFYYLVQKYRCDAHTANHSGYCSRSRSCLFLCIGDMVLALRLMRYWRDVRNRKQKEYTSTTKGTLQQSKNIAVSTPESQRTIFYMHYTILF